MAKKKATEEEKKDKGGRPPIWTDPIELKQLVMDYFNETERPTLAGLAVHLGVSRKTLYNYENKDEFLHIIKNARERVEAIYEERLLYEDKPTGAIFALKNMGWSDSVKQDVTSGGEKIKPLLGGISKSDELQSNDSDKETEQTPEED